MSHRPVIHRLRLRAVLSLGDRNTTELAACCGVVARHFDSVVAGRRPLTDQLAQRVAEQLGGESWKFVTGETDVLHAPPVEERKAKRAPHQAVAAAGA